MLVDTHAHLWFPDYYPASRDQPGYFDELERVLTRAKAAGVEKMIVPGTDVESSGKATALAKQYPGWVYAAIGVHPEEVLEDRFQILDVSKLIAEYKELIVAIGEIGTDASTEELKSCMGVQQELFRAQCELALEYDQPVIIHTRNSLAETLEILDNLPQMPRGQFHCFSHDETGIAEVVKRGFHVSFCGNITWSKRVAKLVGLVSDDRLLLETDSPLMVPRDKDGFPIGISERNEPANVAILAQKIADLRGQTLEEVAKFTTENAIRLFRL